MEASRWTDSKLHQTYYRTRIGIQKANMFLRCAAHQNSERLKIPSSQTISFLNACKVSSSSSVTAGSIPSRRDPRHSPSPVLSMLCASIHFDHCKFSSGGRSIEFKVYLCLCTQAPYPTGEFLRGIRALGCGR